MPPPERDPVLATPKPANDAGADNHRTNSIDTTDVTDSGPADLDDA